MFRSIDNFNFAYKLYCPIYSFAFSRSWAQHVRSFWSQSWPAPIAWSIFVWQPCIADKFSRTNAYRWSLLTSRPSKQPRNGSSLNPILIGFQSWMTSLMLATSCLKGDVICECDLIIVKLPCFMSFWAQPLLNFLNDTGHIKIKYLLVSFEIFRSRSD